ncbi:hypothetical protein C3492_36195 [Streptomyces sp. Ru62]|nr:hypothetical protein C3492_36195 [Streptomyces sp. Ru62]
MQPLPAAILTPWLLVQQWQQDATQVRAVMPQRVVVSQVAAAVDDRSGGAHLDWRAVPIAIHWFEKSLWSFQVHLAGAGHGPAGARLDASGAVRTSRARRRWGAGAARSFVGRMAWKQVTIMGSEYVVVQDAEPEVRQDP